jgi:hypothetical protein
MEVTVARKTNGAPSGENEDAGMSRNAVVDKLKDIGDARRLDAIKPEHELKSSDVWKEQQKLWKKACDTQRKSWLYAIVLFDGVATETKKGLQLIAKYFNIHIKELEPYKDVINMADAARVLKINRNQLSASLGRDDQPNFKFFMGKQFAYQVSEPAHEGVESIDEGGDITIKVLTKDGKTEATKDETVLTSEGMPGFDHRVMN